MFLPSLFDDTLSLSLSMRAHRVSEGMEMDLPAVLLE